ncbi:uncharacterized protein YndB with AHSA1/START domain [Herbihabitans rhizosphaerae]|uniref:Uncharacterized protein YndB with AHSA1/START domain n=1 Tax=Herbihabitans rhizosphaerae TaxID=1872711 RepID=A0A4Q7L3B7_9PSEU|nr:SRPBCC family protein [Herbihabitans rhizosphaerae]RZS43727.1 uncharacterized protein YndB with AHSA1/START domain [Herbihabitans rhizosphaerae]
MEYGSIEREIYVEASPEVVYEVVSSPEHLKEWWPDDVELDPVPGGTGELVWGDRNAPEARISTVTVVDAQPPRLFSFRWCHQEGEVASPGNSTLVTFELTPSENGTTVHLTESGFREQGWEAAVLEASYNSHVEGWDYFVPRLGAYVARLVSTP